MSHPRLSGLLILLSSVVLSGELDDFHWREDFSSVARWTAQPAWLSAPSPTASVTTDGRAACFRVDEPRKGMKWSLSLPMVSLAETPWLVVRYRADGLLRQSDDYFIYLDDGVEGRQLHALRLSEVVADGQWHVVAVDVSTLTRAEAIRGLAVQVQATDRGSARLWLEQLAFAESPPEGAETPRRVAQPPSAVTPRPDWIAPLAQATWTHHVNWLPNPASDGRHGVERRGDATVFRVAESSKGMKWSWDLPQPVPLEGHRYVSMRYRASGLSPGGDYALCVIGRPRGSGEDYTPVISLTDLISDSRWHTLHADLRPAAARFPAVGAFAIQVQAAAHLPSSPLSTSGEGGRGGEAVAPLASPPNPLSASGEGEKGVRPSLAGPPLPPAPSPPTERGSQREAPKGQPEPCAILEVSDIRFVNAIQPSRLADAIDWQPGARFDSFQPIPLGDAAKSDVGPWLRRLALADWFSAAEITAQGIPFRLNLPRVSNPREVMSLAATGVRAKGDLRFPCDLRASEVYLLLLAAFVGPEEPVYGGGKLNAIRDLDRFRLRLEYADGTADECLPMQVRAKRAGEAPAEPSFGIVAGPQVLVAAANDSKPLKAIILRDACKQAAFALAALTARAAGDAALPEAREQSARLHGKAMIRFPRTLWPGDDPAAPVTCFPLEDGGWRQRFDAYRARVKQSLKPLLPRQPWFREVFNFRQRFLWAHDPLYDAKTGKFRLEEAIEEAKREFGGIDFLHLFDWGNCGKYGRIYGRTGDYSPYDYYKGGQEALRKAIAGVRAKGVPVGLYIEGYLLEERGKLGQQFGKLWQMIGPDGKGRWWPQSTEMYVCPFVPAWREVQASTYAAKVKELDVDGMYLDEFGFAGANVDCWSKEHGHEVPGYAVVGERDCTKLVRERIEAAKKGVVLYTEESPVDVTTQFQDGSFTYAMAEARRTQTLVPLNLTRFAFPDFKTIEILVCDHPTGSWATGVKWVFFNGEALWIEGPPDWFEPETREAIRRCYRILRKHKDAFTGLRPVPLVPTEMGGVWANKFPSDVVGQTKTVYTLYNARHRTVRGELLRIPHAEGATYYDEWNQRPASFRRLGEDAAIALEIGPNDVGCLVVEERK